MPDTAKIVAGLVVFVGLVGLPFWYNVAAGTEPRLPAIERPKGEDRCILDAATMRREHMQLLADWREQVVREGRRDHVTADGRHYRRSLTGTCLGCHTDRQASCDRCHASLSVTPYCWDCHVETRGVR